MDSSFRTSIRLRHNITSHSSPSYFESLDILNEMSFVALERFLRPFKVFDMLLGEHKDFGFAHSLLGPGVDAAASIYISAHDIWWESAEQSRELPIQSCAILLFNHVMRRPHALQYVIFGVWLLVRDPLPLLGAAQLVTFCRGGTALSPGRQHSALATSRMPIRL